MGCDAVSLGEWFPTFQRVQGQAALGMLDQEDEGNNSHKLRRSRRTDMQI